MRSAKLLLNKGMHLDVNNLIVMYDFRFFIPIMYMLDFYLPLNVLFLFSFAVMGISLYRTPLRR